VADDGLGATLPLRGGLGVGNTRERLTALYGERAALRIESAPDAGFSARIEIPCYEGRS
jgi:sensor histidine kinase YesM